MGVRSVMVHRATVQRSTVADPFATFGQTTTSSIISTSQSCYIQERSATKITGSGRFFAVGTLLGLFPLTADIADEDVIEVGDRRGRVLWGSLRVESLLPPRENHQEALLERYGSIAISAVSSAVGADQAAEVPGLRDGPGGQVRAEDPTPALREVPGGVPGGAIPMEPGAGEPPMPRLQADDGLALSGGALPRPPGGAEEGDEPGQDGAVEGSTELLVLARFLLGGPSLASAFCRRRGLLLFRDIM